MLSHKLIFCTLVMGLMGCPTSQPQGSNLTSSPQENRPLVVATTSVLCDLTHQVAQETINLNCLVGAGGDPHVYQPTPKDRQEIDKAQLILYGGYNFDVSLIKLIEASNNPAPKIAVHEQAVSNPLMGKEHDHGHEEHHQEATETVPDPHVWHDANNGIKMVQVISQQLATLQPHYTKQYKTNERKITQELTSIHTWIQDQIATIPIEQRKLVTTHDALGYYVKAYDLAFEGALGGFSTEESPTAARVRELVKDVEKTKVPTIFAETTINSKLIQTVAKEAKVKVAEETLYTDSLGKTGTTGETYQKMLISNTKTIVTGLGGKYTEFSQK